MAKNAKKGTTGHGKPITDFFTLASKPHPQVSKSRVSPSVPSQAGSSQVVRTTGASETTEALLNKLKVASITSKPKIESSSRVHGHEFLDGSESGFPQYSTKTGLPNPPFASPVAISSLKRVRSPDFQPHTRASTPLNSKKAMSYSLKTPDRRRGKFDSDSDIETTNTVIHVKSTVCHNSILQWPAYSHTLPVQSAKTQKSSSFTSRGFFSCGLLCSKQPVWRRGPCIHEGTGTSANAYSGKQ